MRVAALYVAKNGSYVGLAGVDAWPETRDARLYVGPHPVVAHPPCQRWGKLWAGQPLHIKRTGERKVKGADGGCFEAALSAVRSYGGVLEHPCDSHAWPHFNLNKPPREGGWIAADLYGGWTCYVEQGRYGHYARKPTWLYAFGCNLPELDWGKGEPRLDPVVVARMGFKRAQRLGEVGGRGGGTNSAPRISTPGPVPRPTAFDRTHRETSNRTSRGMTHPQPEEKMNILDLELGRNDAKAKTVRDYLKALLAKVWDEEEGFSGKRPFGNSGWKYDVYPTLIKAKLVTGKLDSDGNLEDCDYSEADRLILGAIESLT